MVSLTPDGKWMAFASDEQGRDQVYVMPFPGPGRRWVASKTSDVAGDGTTTATVLAQALFREGSRLVASYNFV